MRFHGGVTLLIVSFLTYVATAVHLDDQLGAGAEKVGPIVAKFLFLGPPERTPPRQCGTQFVFGKRPARRAAPLRVVSFAEDPLDFFPYTVGET
jgi:hypothetical protein